MTNQEIVATGENSEIVLAKEERKFLRNVVQLLAIAEPELVKDQTKLPFIVRTLSQGLGVEGNEVERIVEIIRSIKWIDLIEHGEYGEASCFCGHPIKYEYLCIINGEEFSVGSTCIGNLLSLSGALKGNEGVKTANLLRKLLKLKKEGKSEVFDKLVNQSFQQISTKAKKLIKEEKEAKKKKSDKYALRDHKVVKAMEKNREGLIEFLDIVNNWWLETDRSHPNRRVGQMMRIDMFIKYPTEARFTHLEKIWQAYATAVIKKNFVKAKEILGGGVDRATDPELVDKAFNIIWTKKEVWRNSREGRIILDILIRSLRRRYVRIAEKETIAIEEAEFLVKSLAEKEAKEIDDLEKLYQSIAEGFDEIGSSYDPKEMEKVKQKEMDKIKSKYS